MAGRRGGPGVDVVVRFRPDAGLGVVGKVGLMKLTLRGQLLVLALIAVGTIVLGAVVSYASGMEPLPEPPQWHPGVTSR